MKRAKYGERAEKTMALCPMTAPRYSTLPSTTEPGGGWFPLARGRIRLHYAHAEAVMFPDQVAWLQGINDLDTAPSVSRMYQVFVHLVRKFEAFLPWCRKHVVGSAYRLLSRPLDQPP